MPHQGPSCRRTQILDAACELFRRQGPSKTTIAQIAHAAEVGVGTVYLEFRSKAAIIAALSGRRHAGVLAAMRVAARDETRGFEARFQAIFDVRTERLLELASDGDHASSLLCASSCAAVREACSTFHDSQVTLIEEFLKGARDAGVFMSQGAATARAVILAYASFEAPKLLARDPAQLTAELSAMHRLILGGLLQRAG